MTLPIERARSRRPVTWLTLIGVLLLPVVIGGVLVAALYNPVERLDAMNTAVVNNDEPVTLDGQMVPLGRQLTAGLVEGSDDLESNLNWTISNDEDAAAGLADGTYDAVITIPENFSAAATSTAPGNTPERATIEVTTAPDSLIVDDAITAQVTQAAADLMGEQLSSLYLENVFLGFTTLGDQLGEAADGAQQLADGATEAATGAATWADGADTAAAGAYSLADGIRELAGGADGLADGAGGIADGASGLAGGAAQLAAGTTATADGLNTWAAGARDISAGTSDLAGGLQLMADQVGQLPAVPQEIIDGVNEIAGNSGEINTAVTDAAARLAQAAADCAAQGGSAQLCATLAEVSTRTNEALPTITGVIDQSADVAAQVEQLAQFGPALTAGLQDAADGASALAGGMNELADGATATATGAGQLAGGMSDLADGATQLSGGATQLATGAQTFATGAGAAAGGAGEFADGIGQLADGARDLSDGVGQLSDGAGTLAEGLGTAAEALPSYTDDEATDLASVVANPVEASGLGTNIFGASAIPLLAMLALWFGGLASFIALQAVPRHALSSRRPSALLAARSLAPAAAIGAAQGLLVAGIVQLAAEYDAGTWFAFAGLAVLAGVAFAAVNQALVAVFGGAGRWIAALVGVLAVATGIVSTVPGVLTSIAGLMPTTPVYDAMLAALTGAGGVGAGIVGMIVWTGLAFIATIIAVTRRRSTSARAVLTASIATA
ncbi:YhgE/Pip family protein [Microbacterium invictum]|uniref:Membrane protein n=1 Tax=Microbacterium invictum TaxID=515415 RepID=A0AA40SLB0_9MICO|nr:YhgE/Pip family protein [Microbacterium invictum]MBB4138277.1 putative membrane protein [Microbacterium invictum]